MKFKKSVLILLAALCCTNVSASGIAEGEPRTGWSLDEVRHIPVQVNGRIKPIDTFARESVLLITGSRTLKGWDPVDLLFSWIVAPSRWEEREFIQVQREDVKRQLGLDEKRSLFSPKELIQDSYLAQYAGELSSGGVQGKMAPKEQDPRKLEMKQILNRIGLYRHLVSGDAWPVIPMKAQKAWGALSTGEEGGKSGHLILVQFRNLFYAYHSGDLSGFEKSAEGLRLAVESQIQNWDFPQKRLIDWEIFYNGFRPFLWAWIFYLSGFLIWILRSQLKKKVFLEKGSLFLIGLGWSIHIVGIFLRCNIAGRPPVSNMYESVIWVSFGVLVFAWILYFFTGKGILLAVASCLGSIGLIIADSSPTIMDPGINPLVPVLRSNYWLTIHVLTITLSYAAFALSYGLSNLTLFEYLKKNTQKISLKISGLNQLSYRAMQFGVVLLAAGTILGGVWADYSWGRFWGWDPKEVWALTALLGYLVVLHARFAGWVGQFGFTVWTVLCFMSVMMAWYGVNFVLGQGLHSYGFSSGGQGWVGGFLTLQLGYILSVVFLRARRMRAG